ncbi:MAG TPA: hypothetical protein VH298_12210 [Jatrophihabitans sp.]|jgi:hypothetical protein|nr:hypothetical protein [Jatrophihabitans sp.]
MQTERFAPVQKLNIHLDPQIELETLQDIIARIYKNSGCSPCGRLSFTINAVDPAVVSQAAGALSKVAGVRSVELGF